MSDAFSLWRMLPDGLLKIKFGSWRRYSPAVRRVIAELAEKQRFRCAMCHQDYDLEIDHDHNPEHGTGDAYTEYNIRGLLCHFHNWHLMIYEKDEAGEDRGFEHVDSIISYHQREDYIFAYECRVEYLLDALLEASLGTINYLYRQDLLRKFDCWKEWGDQFPGYWGFDEIKDKKYGKIRTPRQFIKTFEACLKFVVGQMDKSPDFRPPDEFVKIVARIKPMFDELRPIIEQRLKEKNALLA